MMTLNAIELLTFEWFIYVTSVLSQLKKYIQTEKKNSIPEVCLLVHANGSCALSQKEPFRDGWWGLKVRWELNLSRKTGLTERHLKWKLQSRDQVWGRRKE